MMNENRVHGASNSKPESIGMKKLYKVTVDSYSL